VVTRLIVISPRNAAEGKAESFVHTNRVEQAGLQAHEPSAPTLGRPKHPQVTCALHSNTNLSRVRPPPGHDYDMVKREPSDDRSHLPRHQLFLSPPPLGHLTDPMHPSGIDDALYELGFVTPADPLHAYHALSIDHEELRDVVVSPGSAAAPFWPAAAVAAMPLSPPHGALPAHLTASPYESHTSSLPAVGAMLPPPLRLIAGAGSGSESPSPVPRVSPESGQPRPVCESQLTMDDVRSVATMCDLLPPSPNGAGTFGSLLPFATPAARQGGVASMMRGGGSGDPARARAPVPSAATFAAVAAAEAAATAGPGESRKFRCPFPGCTMRLSRPSHLEKHVRTHTNERPHKCSVCDMAFKTKWTLKKHTRIHTGEKPFRCDFPGCGKEFTQRGTFRRHERLHSDNAHVFTCHCGKTFKQRSNYTMHTRSHSSLRTFECNLCSKPFKSARSLEKHRLLHVTSQRTADGRKIELSKQYCRYCAKAFHYVAGPDGSILPEDQRHFAAHEAGHTTTRLLDPPSLAMPTLSMAVPEGVAAAAYDAQHASNPTNLQVSKPVATKGDGESSMQEVVLQLC